MSTLGTALRHRIMMDRIRGFDAMAYDNVPSSPCLPGRNDSLVVPVERERAIVTSRQTSLADAFPHLSLKDTVERLIDPETHTALHTGTRYQCPRCNDPRCLNRALSPCHTAITWREDTKVYLWQPRDNKYAR